MKKTWKKIVLFAILIAVIILLFVSIVYSGKNEIYHDNVRLCNEDSDCKMHLSCGYEMGCINKNVMILDNCASTISANKLFYPIRRVFADCECMNKLCTLD